MKNQDISLTEEKATINKILKALYCGKKRSILQFYKLQSEKQTLYSQSYIYAIEKDCYPYFDEDEDAELFNDFYCVDKVFIESVINIIGEKEDSQKKLFYYELENLAGKKNIRPKLICFLRYAFLSNKFSPDFFETLLSNENCPIEAKSITKPSTEKN